MLTIEPTIPFQATWHPSLTPIGGWRAVLTRITSIACCIPNSVIALCINPSSRTRFEPRDETIQRWRYFSQEIVTPDGIRLVANVQLIEGATPQTPTVILFNPLAGADTIHHRMVWHLSHNNCNTVTFNYRSYCQTRKTTDLVVDGQSVYQYVRQSLGTVAEQIHFFGYSLGGAVATQIRELHPEGKLVADRSFKSLFSLLSEGATARRLGRIIGAITRLIGTLIASIVCVLGWELNGERVIPLLNPQRCRFTYLDHDGLVAREASLASAAPDQSRCLLTARYGNSSHFYYIAEYREFHTLIDFLRA